MKKSFFSLGYFFVIVCASAQAQTNTDSAIEALSNELNSQKKQIIELTKAVDPKTGTLTKKIDQANKAVEVALDSASSISYELYDTKNTHNKKFSTLENRSRIDSNEIDSLKVGLIEVKADTKKLTKTSWWDIFLGILTVVGLVVSIIALRVAKLKAQIKQSVPYDKKNDGSKNTIPEQTNNNNREPPKTNVTDQKTILTQSSNNDPNKSPYNFNPNV